MANSESPSDRPDESRKRRSTRKELKPISYSVDDAAVVTGVSRTLLYNAMCDKAPPPRLAFVKIRSRRIILRDDLIRWLRKYRRRAA